MVVFVVVTTVSVFTGGSGRHREPLMVSPATPDAEPGALLPDEPVGRSNSQLIQSRAPLPSASVTPSPSAGKTTAPAGSVPGATHPTPPRTGAPSPSSSGTAPTPRPGHDPTPTTPTPGFVIATYHVDSTWEDGFTASFDLVNNTNTTQSWRVKIIHDRSAVMRVHEVWNARLVQGGATTNVFVGADLAPGARLTFGFKASKRVDDELRPSSCTINGRPCAIG